jgi:hypothetical protein
MHQTKRASFAAVCLAIFLGPNAASAQYTYESKNEAGAVDSLTYVGGSEWLVAQEDPKSHWHRLPELTDVTLHNFPVSREALLYVLSLKTVKGLVLGGDLEGIEIESNNLELLAKADHLEHLGLCCADISDGHLRSLSEMDNLESLDIGSFGDSGHKARFTDELAHILVATPKLRWIRIHSDNFTDEFIRILSAKRDLEAIEIHSPQLTDASLALIGKLPAMRELRLRSPLITDEGVGRLCDLASLEELVIESPKLGTGALSLVSGLPRLTYLDLSIGSVRSEDLATVQNLKTLKTLALRKSPISDEEFAVLRDHPSIETLFFERAQPTEQSLPVIESLKKLGYVHFSTKTEATRLLLDRISKRGIQDGSFYPKPE